MNLLLNKIQFVILCMLCIRQLFAGDWEVISEMPVAVKGGQAVLHDTLIYIVGGYTDDEYAPVNIIQVFNPRENSWHISEDTLEVPRYGLSANRYRHNMVIMGGAESGTAIDSSLEMWDYASPHYLYDFDGNFNRKFATSQVYGNSIFMFGGLPLNVDINSPASPYIFEYVITLSQPGFTGFADYGNWGVEGQQMPVQQMSALIGDRVYLLGGAFNGLQRSIEQFNVLTHEWKKHTAVLQEERAAGAAVSLEAKAVALIGGYNESSPAMNTVEILNVEDTSQVYSFFTDPLNFGRSELMAVNYDGLTYVFGGVDAQGHCVAEVEAAWLEIAFTGIEDQPHMLRPGGFGLIGNYPNPFNGSTVIKIRSYSSQRLTAEVYDITGRKVRTLADRIFPDGLSEIHWDGANETAQILPSGVYILRVKSGHESRSHRLMMLR